MERATRVMCAPAESCGVRPARTPCDQETRRWQKTKGLLLEVERIAARKSAAKRRTKENDNAGWFRLVGILAFVAIFVLTNIIKILREYERGVVFTLGRVGATAAGPGLVSSRSRPFSRCEKWT